HALLAAAHGRPMSADLSRHVGEAFAHWRRGDRALANIRLAFAGIPQLDDYASAYRLFLAEELLDAGMSPAALMKGLGFEPTARGLAKYSPNQPRVPAGSGRESGRWGSGGGDHSTNNVRTALNVDPHVASDARPDVTPAQGAGYPVDLIEQEQRGGHTIERHVTKSEDYLIRRSEASRKIIGRIDDWAAFGSFTSLQAAGKLVNSTIADNQEIVDQVAAPEDQGGLDQAEIKKTFSQPTGYESYAPSGGAKFQIRNAFSVKVIIRHDETTKSGYRVVTSFPYNP
ncbi:MAG: RNase A-like domain-containing protein, partial [Methylocystis sp.]